MVFAAPGGVGGGGGLQFLTIIIIPKDPAQVPVLAKNVAVQGRDDRSHQEGPQFIPVPKVQGG